MTEDQRGVERYTSTCMGAYELKCSEIKKTLTDTVTVGDPYTFNETDLSTLTAKVGVHTHSETFQLESGCDSIVTLILAVRPQKRTGGYYVKVDGTGDGSDWVNAMSPEDFATYLPLAYDKDTFHVAAGTYRCEVEDPTFGRTYCVNKDVAIIGGYPDTVKTVGTPSIPEIFTTLLTANGKSEDHMSFYLQDVTPSFGSFNDNQPSLLRIVGQPSVALFGITFSGTNNTEDGAISLVDGATLSMDRCVVKQNLASAIYAKDANITVSNSDFSMNFSSVGSAFNVTNTKLDVRTSTIHENYSHETLGNNSEAKGAVAYLDQSSAVFANNTIAKNKAGEGAVFVSKGSELNLTNNTITGNTIEQGSAHTGSVFTFVDESSKLKLFGNIIVANGKSSVVGTATITSSDYNIFSPDFTTTKGAHDMVMKNAEVPFVLDVEEMTGYDDLCNPSLRDNGGYTPTVAVFQSSFDGGEVLSIPKESRAVDLDQRGYIRKETSCVGAFEYPTYVNYYVKTRSHGDGSGRDWANAMGDTTFARYFSIVPSNATFHVAEGLYHPMFDWTGKLVKNANVSYSTSRPINVIGSYPADAQEGDVADATKYATILSADINGNDEYTHKDDNLSYWKYSGYMDNISRVIDITLKQSGVCRLYGLTLTGNYPMFRGSSAALGLFTSKKDIKSSLHLDSCVFTKTYAGIYSSVDTLIMKSCRFDTILSTGVNQTYRSQPYTNWTVDGCSFSSTNIAMSYTIKVGLLHIQNTTINNVLAATEVIPSWDKTDINIELYNNTISLRKGIQNLLVLPDFAKTVMKGNVFNTTFKFTSETGKEVIPVVSDYNLYTYAPDETGKVCPIGEHDLLVEPKDLVDVLDGSLEDEVFVSVDGVPSEKDITSVVKVKNDKLEDGSVIRLPLENTVVSVDEVGQERLPMTCMGAYEIRCVPDTTVSADTIFVGETFLGTTYINIGRNDSIFEILQDVAGCDSVVMHTLIVLPDPTKTNYYVRTERHSTGDGSSWKDAMDGRDFEQAIPLVPEGTTFYIAEGVYTPKGTLIKGNSGLRENLQGFVANTKVNIIGGFPDDADLGTPPNPKLYKTILNGDIKGDDEVVYLKNVCGIDSVVIRNTEDNLYDVIHIASTARDQGVKSINIQGITVKGGEHSGISYCTNYDVKVTFEKCTLTQCQRAIDCWPSDFDVKECTFTDNQIGVASYNNLSYNITIEKSTFNRNNTAVSGGYHTTISNSTFANCCRSISMRIRDNSNNVLDLKNNTFINVGDGVLLPIPYIYEGDDITGSFNMFAIGNIIDSKCTSVKITDANESDKLPTSYLMSYNVLAQSQINETIKPHIGDNNIILEDINSLYGVMDGTLKNDAFVPNVIDNGGFTPTIALKADKLPDGTSIRFPLSETAVTDDQRSVERLTQTCIGAYEITDTDCEIGTILFLEDFGGNYVSDAPRRADPLPKSVNNLNYSSHLWNLGFNAYSLRKVAIKRSGSPNPEHIYTGWYAEFGDHTHESDTTRGYFMQIDFENMESTFYNYTVDNLCENTHLYFSFWGHPVNATKDGYVILSIEDPNGNTLGKEKFIIDHANNKWQQFGMPFVVPKGINSVVYRAHSGANSLGGDFALDDISIRLCKPAVNVNMPLDSICADEDYSLTASYNNIGGYIEPVNFTWYKNTERTYDLEGWEKVAEGKDITFKNLQLEDNAYYRCVISSADVPGEFNKCNSASDIIPILVKSCVVCDPDTTLLTEPDVIQVGEQFLGVTYSEMGRYDSIPENLKNIMGCDSVVLHSLVVTPAPAVKEYYVKTSRQGTGDGSNWENAMDGTDFANTLPFAPEGAAYYIAEGSYKPLCEENNCKYIINGSVSIYGGYPADAVTGALSDPKKYVTVFNGDFKGDDKVVESLDERGCRLVDVENTDDNVYDMFYASVENPLDVTLSGISVMNVNRGFVAFSGSVENEVNVNVLDCRFENCRSSAIQSESLGTIKVSNSEFSNNSNCLYVSNAIDVTLKNVTMTDNYGPYLVYMSNIHEDKTANLSMESVVAKNNTSYVHFWGDIDVTQSKFDNNSCVYSLILTPNADGFSPKINVDNSEFTNNTCEAHLIYASVADVTVSNSLFEGNAMGYSLIYPYNLTVDMSSILGNKCETGNIFKVVKNAEFTNDVINDNVSISMIDYYTATDCKLLIDTCHVEANKGQLLTSGGTSNAFDARITRSDFIKNSLDEDENWIMLIGNGTDVTVLMERDIMKENNFSNSMISSSSVEFTMNECHLQGNEASMLINFASSVAHIKNSAFEQNHVEKSVVSTNVCWDGIDIVNNTFASNKSDNSLFDCYYSSVVYNDNTIVGNDVAGVMFSRPYDKSFIGNIVWGNKYSELNYYGFSSVPQYNIMPLSVGRNYTETEKVKVFVPDETNIVADYYLDNYKNHPEEYEFGNESLLESLKQYGDIKDLFFGNYDASTGLFVPEIKDNGGYTPTVALRKDKIADGTSIRFLLEQTIVTKDQRGVDRLVSTCMGAYEYMPSEPLECVYETVLFKEDFGGNDEEDETYSEDGLKEGLCTLPCAGDCPLAVDQFSMSGCYSLLKKAHKRRFGYREDHIYEGWYADFDDDTYPKDEQRGYFMSIDMGINPTTFYQRRIDDICENTNLSLSMSARPLYAATNTVLYMSVEDLSGNRLSENTEVVINKDVNDWQEFNVTFTVPQGHTSVMFKIYSDGGHMGNDFAMDDITIRLCKERVDVNQPEGPLCKHTDYTLTASFPGDPSYLEPVNYTWFRNDVESYDLKGWKKVGTGKTLEFKDMSSDINGYYRCVVSSAGVEGTISKCSSISDVVPIFVSEYTQERDTVHINQGESVGGIVYDKVGVFRTSEREVNEFGCDRLLSHVIFVHPTGAEYYVTMEGRANHTGLDWDNALDSVEFATYLPLSKAGVTYHIAEGRYLPCYNSRFIKEDKYCYYAINNDVTIIGGYSKDELDETVPNNPKKYRTEFSASRSDNNCMKLNDVSKTYDMYIEPGTNVGSGSGLFLLAKEASEVKFDGVILKYCRGIKGYDQFNNLTLNRCTFEEMSNPVRFVHSLHIDSCYFRKLSVGGAPSTLFGGVMKDLIIRNTTITDNLGEYNMLTVDYYGVDPEVFVLENSTLVNNSSQHELILLPFMGTSRITNNTIVNNKPRDYSLFGRAQREVDFTGNLIVSNNVIDKLEGITKYTDKVSYKYNLLDVTDDIPETNMRMVGKASSILDGWDIAGGFSPTLRDNGGYTPTLALKSDRLSDGVSIIRFPLTNTTVKADQRQYARLEKTCMGAYEIPLAECTDELGLPKEHKLTYETQTISFTVPYRCDVRVTVYDLQGRLVRNADMLYRDREGDVTINLSDLRLFELDHDPREPFLLMVKMGGKIHVSYLYITRLDKNY